VELGPGNVLGGLIRKIDRTVSVVSLEDPDGVAALGVASGSDV
jgi:malonyl CoA-acyl carrier protein transacylase